MERKDVLGLAFERFVLSVIRQKCISQKKPFFSEHTMFDFFRYIDKNQELRNEVVHGLIRFDGYAPQGFDEFHKPVIIEVKHNVRNMKFRPLIADDEHYISLYIINSNLSDQDRKRKTIGNNIYVWGQQEISEWAKGYPIDYYSYHAQELKEIVKQSSFEAVVDFAPKIENNKLLLQKLIEERKVSLSLGAGVSIDYGAKGWDNLINEFFQEIKKEEKVDDPFSVQKKLGGTSLINGQFAQENLKDFLTSLYAGLYGNYNPPVSNYTDTTLKYVAKIADKLKNGKNFNVITYNYDNYLEQELDDIGDQYNIIYNEQMVSNDELNIYHPHGYLPFGISSTQYTQYKNSIVFSESEYHKLYNNAYHWSVVLQHYLYRDRTYLFIGCSLTDPNLRRILETTQIAGKTHIALMLSDSLSLKDQFIIHRHFIRMGVECIWFDTLVELKKYLKHLAK